MTATIIDTHCHLTHQRFAADREALIAALAGAGVARAMTIGTGLPDGCAARALARAHPDVIACSIGLDPHTCHELGEANFPTALAELDALLAEGGFSALGEIGLEYHHQVAPPKVQAAQFAAQLDLAEARGLPAVLHVRDAHPDMIALLRARPRPARPPGVIHSFIGNAEEARAYLDLGWHLGFNGTVTYKGNDFLRAAAKLVPDDRLLVETDSPYLAPVPRRGKRCEPADTWLTLDCLAALRGQDRGALAERTSANARQLFAW
jgi:TatD DNase family protein